jgi:O-succinylbenzoate synthase
VKIRKISMFHVAMPLKDPFETSFGRSVYRHGILVALEDISGEIGWGEVVADEGPWYSYETVETAWHVIRDFIAPRIKGLEIEVPQSFWKLDVIRRMRGHNMAKAGVEEALWDLWSRMMSQPLWKVIGGVRDRISSGVSIGIQESPEKLVKVVRYYLEKGYQRIKIKIKPGYDLEPVAAIRREYPDIMLSVDANAAYTLEDADHLKKLDRYSLLMIEQPLHYEDLVDHAELAKILETPICLDESIKDPHVARSAIRIGAAEIINIKPGRVGGIAPSKEIHDIAEKAGIPVWIGGMLETGVGRGVQVALASLRNVKLPNDISASERYYEEDIVEPPWILQRGGYIEAPNKPGLGVEVVEKKMLKYTVKYITI